MNPIVLELANVIGSFARAQAIIELDRLGLLRSGTALCNGAPVSVVRNDIETAKLEGADTHICDAALRILRIVELAEQGKIQVETL